MGRRGRGSFLDLLQGFNEGYNLVGKVLSDKEMRDIATAKQESGTGFTDQQGADLNAAAASGQYDVQPNAAGGYDVTPKANGETVTDAGPTSAVAPVQRTSFLGKTYDKPLTDNEADKARLMAMSGVMGKFGNPVEAMKLRQQAAQAGLMDLQVKGAERSERQAAEADNFHKSMKAGFSDFLGTGSNADGTALPADQALAARAAKWRELQGAVLANPMAGKDWLPALDAAKQRAIAGHLGAINPGVDATTDQVIGYIKGAAKAQAQFGDVMTPDQLEATRERVTKMEKEGYTQALEAAARGDMKEANRLWNQAGSMRGDLLKLEPGKMAEQFGGLPTFVATYRGADGQTHTVNVGDTLMQAQTLKDRFEMADKAAKTKADQVRANAAATSAGADMTKANVAVATGQREAEKWGIEKKEVQAKADDSAAVSAARKGLGDALRSGDAKAIETARAMAVAAGVKFEKPTLEFTTTTDQMGEAITRTNKDTGEMDIVDRRTGAVKNIPAPGRPANAAFANETELARAVKEGKVRSGDTVLVGGRVGRVN